MTTRRGSRGGATRGVQLLALCALVTACAGEDVSEAAVLGDDMAAPIAQAAPSSAADADIVLPEVVVFKTSGCGCCNGWVEHLREAGFEVDARDVRDLVSVKTDAGVPADMQSCHTALVDGYVVEGHVPADVMRRLLAERPDLVGIAVPGMPIGSPGMEGPNARPYLVHALERGGGTHVYQEVDPTR